MKFRTEIPVNNARTEMNYLDGILFLGSCFSIHIHEKLLNLKFNSLSNPFGIVYNPLSLSSQLLRIVNNEPYQESDLHFHNERWFSFDHHSDFSYSDKKECLSQINESLTVSHEKLKSAKFLFLTFGSSWVYHRNENQEVVSNCHKIPAKEFSKFLAETQDMFEQVSYSISEIKKINPTIQVEFSVSPIRHLADGFFENQLSKGRLFDLIHQLKEWDNSFGYFPSYEFLMDDLRDYRFYKSDLVHPSEDAIRYIWEKYVSTYLTGDAEKTMNQVDKVIQAANHRPFNSGSDAHKKFIAKTISRIKNLEKQVFGGFQEEKRKLTINS